MPYEIDFLPVGDESKAGDAIVFRYGNISGPRDSWRLIVIDGGMSETGPQVVEFIKRTYNTDRVDDIISTHPDGDHINGLSHVIDAFKVGRLFMHKPWTYSREVDEAITDRRTSPSGIYEKIKRSLQGANDLAKAAERKGIKIIEPFSDLPLVDNDVLVLGPSQDFYRKLVPEFRAVKEYAKKDRADTLLGGGLGEALRTIGSAGLSMRALFSRESLVDPEPELTSAENRSSVITLLKVDGQRILLTGDAGSDSLRFAIDKSAQLGIVTAQLYLLQIPHHGSRRNIGPTLLNHFIGPILPEAEANKASKTKTFFSVPKKGEPKHPSSKVVNACYRRGAFIAMTKGKSVCQTSMAPSRSGYTSLTSIGFINEEVEGDD